MNKWLSRGGLSAVFKDVTLAPARLSVSMYENGLKKQQKAFGAIMAVGGHLPALNAGFIVGITAGPVVGVAAYFAFTNAFMGILCAQNNKLAQSFFPRITAFAQQGKEQTDPPAPQ